MLEEYKAKRNFRHTPEPPSHQPGGEGPLIFVVQKHAARRLHYDFRLEVNGVLKSWSVPKGPSLNPNDKRLAVMVDDHPLEYASFEGEIPKGQYGAGQVIVWDSGTYSPDEEGELLFNQREEAQKRLADGLARGKLSIQLRGRKLQGSWALVRMRQGKNEWLLIKHRDNEASEHLDILEDDASVISGRTITDLKEGHPAPITSRDSLNLKDLPGARATPFPSRLKPMLATPAEAPFTDEAWLFEPKLDGFRVIGLLNQGKVNFLSRNGLDVTQRYGELVEGLKSQPASELILDGEIIALDENGRVCFQCLQNYMKSLGKAPSILDAAKTTIIYYVFDLLRLDGYDLSRVSLEKRKQLLSQVLHPSEKIRPMEYFDGDGQVVYEAAIKNGLEGIIAKRRESTYEAGQRSRDWFKIKKTQSEEFVVGGYTKGNGARAATFGALLLGYYDAGKHLYFAGRVGTGFDERTRQELKRRLTPLATPENPFTEAPLQNAPTTWVSPKLVVEVKFFQWTKDGRLRAPVFLRLREDKPAAEVTPIVLSDKTSDTPSAPKTRAILTQLENRDDNLTFELDSSKIPLSNLSKELWPGNKESRPLTKRDFISYLVKVSPYLLPHLKDRPLTLSRYPGGITGKHFFQKHWSGELPAYVQTVALSSRHGKGRQEYILCQNLETLLWLGQAANIEFHCWFSRISKGPVLPAAKTPDKAADIYVNYPDFIVFDIDPYIYSGKEVSGAEPELNRAAFEKATEIALSLKEILDSLSLPSFIKTSGRTGLHIFVPLVRKFDYNLTHSTAETISRHLKKRYPRVVTVDWAVEKRSGKIFLDYNQNARGKTLASVYSPRAAALAPVSIPISWDELTRVYPTDFTLLTVPERLEKTGDLWAGILAAGRDIENLLLTPEATSEI